ncbi:hypothetical protein [Idiomarina aquatica]|uniref:hypothetical protein n=1 Tax=Idiomarina aquatica TaxID=1327752 RepID=UPI00106062F9|nr:hypothetical protein [Idiomarina aquatica]
MSFFVKYKDHISSIGVIFAIVFSLLALLSNPKEPDLVVSSEKIKNKTRVVIYNGGDGPCAGFKIKYPNHFNSVEQIVQYQESALPNKKLSTNDKDELVIVYPARAPDTLEKCKIESCIINGEFLKPNQAIAFDFYKKKDHKYKSKIAFVCYGDSEIIGI